MPGAVHQKTIAEGEESSCFWLVKGRSWRIQNQAPSGPNSYFGDRWPDMVPGLPVVISRVVVSNYYFVSYYVPLPTIAGYIFGTDVLTSRIAVILRVLAFIKIKYFLLKAFAHTVVHTTNERLC
jgi:hypothetical protein